MLILFDTIYSTPTSWLIWWVKAFARNRRRSCRPVYTFCEHLILDYSFFFLEDNTS